MKPLRDFFIVLFFVFFGSQLAGPITWDSIKIAVFFSLMVFISKPIIVMFLLRFSGYKKKTNFFTGLSLAQISEFSLIILLLGFTSGYISQSIISITVIIALITIGLSSYLLYYSVPIFEKLSWFLGVFEGNNTELGKIKEEHYDIILFGYHRMGYKILNSLKDLRTSFVVVDYNPKVVLSLTKKGIDSIYGDAGSKDFLKEISLKKAKIVISTIPDKQTNMAIREMLNEAGSEAVFIATTEHPVSALDLYRDGVDYVILPHHLGGEYAANMIRSFHTDKRKYIEKGKEHRKELLRSKNNSTFYTK